MINSITIIALLSFISLIHAQFSTTIDAPASISTPSPTIDTSKLLCNYPKVGKFSNSNNQAIYTMTITQDMLNSYSRLEIDTCTGHYYGYTASTNTVIRNPSGSTVLSSSSCIEEDLLNDSLSIPLSAGEYTIQITNINSNIGSSNSTSTLGNSALKYWLQLHCSIYTEPVAEESELEYTNNYQQDLGCGGPYYYRPDVTIPSESVAYYKFNVTSETERPIVFSTCYSRLMGGDYLPMYNRTGDSYEPDTWMYLLYQKPGSTIPELIEHEDDIYDEYGNYRYCAEINRTELADGVYILAVGNYEWNAGSGFTMEVECGVTSNAYIPGENELVGVIIAVVFVALICLTIFMVFYCKQMKKFKADHRSLEKKKSPHHEQNGIKFQEVECEHDIDRHDIDGIILTETTVDRDQIPEDNYSVGSDENEDGDKDRIRQIVSNIIQSCENEADLDIYQVLAFRRLDAKSWKLRLFKPFEPLGIDYELLNISSYHKSIFVAVVVSVLQCVGITVILFSATHAYFNEEDEENRTCHWTLADWNESWHFKMLAFLWCVVITLKVHIDLKKFKANGFTQIIDRVSHNEYHKFYKIVNLNIVQIGYLVNLYTLFIAVFGSYWIVYASEQGSQSVEMVLNAVALFFMIELDDILVTDKDYVDIKIRMKQYLERYNNDSEYDHSQKVDDEKHLNRLIRVSVGTKYCSYFITAITIIGGMIAPWIILLCYG